MLPKSLLGWVVLIVVIWWVIANPHTAGQDVHNVGAFISSALPHGG